MITTSAAIEASIARCAASTLVAFESLTKRTPSTIGNRLERMLEAR